MDTKKVTLVNEALGERDFNADHAARILAIEKKLNVSHWQPKVKAEVKNEANGATSTSDSKSS